MSLLARSLAVSGRAAAGLREAARSPGWNRAYEGLYYGYLAYRMFAVRLGIGVDNLGASWLAGLAAVAALALLPDRVAHRNYTPIVLVGLTAAAFLLFQFGVHHLPPTYLYVTLILVWPLSVLVIVKCLDQPGFMKRLGVAMFVLLIAAWTTVTFELADGSVQRASLQGTDMDNPNEVAAWAGFCALIFWLWGLQQASLGRRLMLWTATAVAFGLMAQTVSRTALLALVIAMLLSLRRFPLRHWVTFAAAMAVLAGLGLLFQPFRQSALNYADRLDNGSERAIIWPLTLQAIAERPLTGHGADKATVFVATRGANYVPHNGVLFFGMASGILPVIPFVALWVAAAFGAVRRARLLPAGELDPIPLLIYAFIFMSFFNFDFLTPWTIAAICYSFPRPADLESAHA